MGTSTQFRQKSAETSHGDVGAFFAKGGDGFCERFGVK
jgi:hypothetical protein